MMQQNKYRNNEENDTVQVLGSTDADFRTKCIDQIITAMDVVTFISKVSTFETLMADVIGHKESKCPDIPKYNEIISKKEEPDLEKFCYHIQVIVKKRKQEEKYGIKGLVDISFREDLAELKWRELWIFFQKRHPENIIGTLGKVECEELCCVERKRAEIAAQIEGKENENEVDIDGG